MLVQCVDTSRHESHQYRTEVQVEERELRDEEAPGDEKREEHAVHDLDRQERQRVVAVCAQPRACVLCTRAAKRRRRWSTRRRGSVTTVFE